MQRKDGGPVIHYQMGPDWKLIFAKMCRRVDEAKTFLDNLSEECELIKADARYPKPAIENILSLIGVTRSVLVEKGLENSRHLLVELAGRWRELENSPVYSEGKVRIQGRTHGGAAKKYLKGIQAFVNEIILRSKLPVREVFKHFPDESSFREIYVQGQSYKVFRDGEKIFQVDPCNHGKSITIHTLERYLTRARKLKLRMKRKSSFKAHPH